MGCSVLADSLPPTSDPTTVSNNINTSKACSTLYCPTTKFPIKQKLALFCTNKKHLKAIGGISPERLVSSRVLLAQGSQAQKHLHLCHPQKD